MPHIHMHKRHIRKALILVLILACVSGVLFAVQIWESHQRQQAMLRQEEIDEPARRRREGWIEKDGQWYAPKSGLETMLVIGVDKTEPLEDSGSYNNDSQADFLLLTILDKTEETATILHLNRDIMTQIPVLGVTGQHAGFITGQLALAHTYGSGLQDSCENTVDAVSMLLGGVDIDHYVGMTMGAVPLINDMVGGVPVTVLDDFSGIDDTLVQGEEITLQGEQAIHYVRIRAGLEDSSNLNRMKRQQQYLQSLVNQVQSLGEDFAPSSQQMEELSRYLISDCTVQELDSMAEKISSYTLEEMQTVAGQAKKGTEYMEFYPDEAALEEQVLDLFMKSRNNIGNGALNGFPAVLAAAFPVFPQKFQLFRVVLPAVLFGGQVDTAKGRDSHAHQQNNQ